MRILLLFCIMLVTSTAWGQSANSSLNLNIPTAPQSYSSDEIRAGDLTCRMAIGSSTQMEFGVVGILDQMGQNNQLNNGFYNPELYNSQSGVYGDFMRDVGVYARITIPIGAPKERLNCNKLYQLELERRRLEVTRLKAEINNLRRLQFEGDNDKEE